MLSIIISSYQPHYFTALEKNIAETCGVPHEIIKIENPGLMGICEAYNKGAEKAIYENLLFIHEDVLFHTQNWGEKLVRHLTDEKTGAIGVVGSNYVPKAPSGWYINSMENSFLYLIQNNKKGDDPVFNDFVTKEKHEVFALDGVFIAISKQKFKEFRFSDLLKGFHGYDTDFSLRVSKKYQNYVISDILIEHFSLGDSGKDWLLENIKVRNAVGSNFNIIKNKKLEYHRFNEFLNQFFSYHEVTVSRLLMTMKYFPFAFLDWKDNKKLIYKYFTFLRYRSYFYSKLKNKSADV